MDRWHDLSLNFTLYGAAMSCVYLMAARLCYLAARSWTRHASRKSRGVNRPRLERVIWDCLAILFVCLMLVRQFDLPGLLASTGREIAESDSWYGERRPYQAVVIGIFAATVFGGFVYVFSAIRGVKLSTVAALVSANVLVLQIGINAISLHQVDAIFHIGFGRLNLYNFLEVSALATVAISASFYQRRSTTKL